MVRLWAYQAGIVGWGRWLEGLAGSHMYVWVAFLLRLQLSGRSEDRGPVVGYTPFREPT